MNVRAYFPTGTEITHELLNDVRKATPDFKVGDKVTVHETGQPDRVFLYAEFAAPTPSDSAEKAMNTFNLLYGDLANTTAKSYPQFGLREAEAIANRMIDARLDAMLESEGINYDDPFHPVKYLDRDDLENLAENLAIFMDDYLLAHGPVYFYGRLVQDLTVEQLRKFCLYLYHKYGGTTA